MSFYLTDGSAELDFYSYATLLLAVGHARAVTAIWIRRLGPALTVIPWIVFYLSVRSQDGYFLLMTPLWLAAAATAPPVGLRRRLAAAPPVAGATDRARRVRRTAPPAGPAARALLAASPPRAVTPVRVGRDRQRRTARACRRRARPAHGAHAQGLWQIERRCRSTVRRVALAPHFTDQHGPGRHAVLERRPAARRELAPGQRGDLSPDRGRHERLCARARTDISCSGR